jgi:hypothetical protein
MLTGSLALWSFCRIGRLDRALRSTLFSSKADNSSIIGDEKPDVAFSMCFMENAHG